jgi:chaperonin GroEL (HSP60 family)
VFPRTLAQNAGLDATKILAKLYSAHERGDSTVGVDVEGGGVADMKARGVLGMRHVNVVVGIFYIDCRSPGNQAECA